MNKVLRSSLFLDLPVVHGFTTREAGNLGYGNRPGDPEVTENRKNLLDVLELKGRNHVQPRQVHSSRVLHAAEYKSGNEADGIYTHRSNDLLSVLTADCVPVLLYHPDGFVAAVHAGWRGLYNDILLRTLELLPPHPVAVIGPAISVCCYEVSESLASDFEKKFGPEVLKKSEPKPHLDLYKVARQQLHDGGVVSLDILARCTHCEQDSFFSYRREGSSGRQMSFIGLT